VSSSLTGLFSRDVAEGRGFPPFCICARALPLLLLPLLLLAVVATTSSCAIEQSDECRQYIACQQEYDEAAQTGPTDFADYETTGVCWQSAENAATCTSRCTEALEALREAAANANIDAPSCAPAQ
jgi:hypothetical protein